MANIEATKAHSWDLSEIKSMDVLGDDGGLFPWSLGEHTELGEGIASEWMEVPWLEENIEQEESE